MESVLWRWYTIGGGLTYQSLYANIVLQSWGLTHSTCESTLWVPHEKLCRLSRVYHCTPLLFAYLWGAGTKGEFSDSLLVKIFVISGLYSSQNISLVMFFIMGSMRGVIFCSTLVDDLFLFHIKSSTTYGQYHVKMNFKKNSMVSCWQWKVWRMT